MTENSKILDDLISTLDKLLTEPERVSSGYAINRAYQIGFDAGAEDMKHQLRTKLGLLGSRESSHEGAINYLRESE